MPPRDSRPGWPRLRGFTLIEVSIALAVGLAALMAGVRLGGEVSLRSKVSAEVQDVARLLGNVRSTYSAYGGPAPYATLGGANLLMRGLVPTALNRGGLIHGRWGPYISLPGTLLGGTPGTAAEILLNGIPPPVCRLLAPALLPLVDEMDVGGNIRVKSAANPNPAPATVATLCNTGNTVLSIRLRKS